MTSPRPTDRAVYLVHRGRVGRGTVRSRMQGSVRRWTQFVPAARMVHAAATLDAVRQVATRCAPWLRVYLGPQLWSFAGEGEDVTAFADVRDLPDGRSIHRIGGQAWRDDGVVLVSGWGSTSSALAILHHEIWHVIEDDLDPEDKAAIGAEVSRGIPFPGTYLDSLTERRARAYDAWASAQDEGWRPATLWGVPLRRVDRIWSYVYGGGLAADKAAGRPIKPRLLPGQAATRSTCCAVGATAKAVMGNALAWPLVVLWPLAGLLFLLHR